MRPTTYAATDTRPLARLGVILAALTMLLALLPAGARAQTAPPPENVSTVNATGERFILTVDGTKFDVEPEEMSIQVGALQVCETCTLTFGEHTFEAALKRENEPNQTVATLTASVTADPDFDYSLVFHYGPDGGYALSLYRDDVRPMPGDETRVEFRHVAQGGAVDYVLTSNGENGSVPNDLRTGTLSNPEWVRQYQVTVNDYELQVYPAGAPQDAAHLAACNPDLELEGASSIVVYVGGRIVPAQDLDNTDVDQTKGFADTCLDLADKGGSYQRSSYTDGYDVRGFDGAALTMALSVPKDSTASVSSPTGPAAPYATSTAAGGTDTAPSVSLTSPADGSTQSGTITLTADASDDDSVSEVTFAVDGTTIGSDTTAPYELDWDSSSVADGSHDITATATDSAGQTASSTVTVTTDNASGDVGGTGGSDPLEPGDYGADQACPDSQVPDSPFTDIAGIEYHERNIECIYWYGLTEGTSADTYSPNRYVQREYMALFITRLMNEIGYDLPQSPPDAFTDDESSSAEFEINQLADVGVVNGYAGTSNYGPDDFVTREQMASFIMRAIRVATGADAGSTTDAFTDDESSSHEPNINALAKLNITSGTSASTYSPERLTTRAEMGSFLARTLDVLYRSGYVSRP